MTLSYIWKMICTCKKERITASAKSKCVESKDIQAIQFSETARYKEKPRADKGWAVKRACPGKKMWCSGLGLRLEMSLVFDFRACDVVYPLDTDTVLLPRSFVLVRCLREANVAISCGRFSWSRQTSLSKGFSYYFHDSTTELYFRSTTRQCRCYSKTKTTKYCLKHEGKSHPWQN